MSIAKATRRAADELSARAMLRATAGSVRSAIMM
jgi:hypothetical protein